MIIKINGTRYELARPEIETLMQGVEPETVRRYFISINGRNYPIKQVFAVAVGLPVASFATGYAFNVLRRLGFEIIDAQAGDRHE